MPAFSKKLSPYEAVLTPNQRLSAHLHCAYQQYMTQKGTLMWETPHIKPIALFIQQLFVESLIQQHLLLPVILTGDQCQYLWETLLRDHEKIKPCSQIPALVRSSYQAYRFCKQWLIDLTAPAFSYSEETLLLQTLGLAYEKRLKEENFVDENQLIAKTIELKKISCTFNKISLCGFLEIYPALENIIDLLKQHNVEVEIFSPNTQKAALTRFTFHDAQTCYQAIAARLKHQWMLAPDRRVAVIVPDLASRREDLESIFMKVFHPEPYLNLKQNFIRAFNLSSGKNLYDYPLVFTALEIFTLDPQYNSLSSLSLLLRSSHLFTEHELAHTAKVADALTELEYQTIHMHTFLKKLKTFAPEICARFENLLVYLQELQTKRHSLAQWLLSLQKCLMIMGWAGTRVPDSHEYQLIHSFQHALQKCQALDIFQELFTSFEAFEIFKKKLQQTLFQPQSHNEPIQILGLLEGIGIDFEEIWLTNLNADTFPAKANPNPFIPIMLQKQLQLPGSSPDREFTYAAQIFKAFQNQTQALYVSHYHQNEGEEKLLPSPFIQGLPETLFPETFLTMPSIETLIYQHQKLEYFSEEETTPISASELTTVKGGTDILKQTALCLFKSYAMHRLHITAPRQAYLGISPLKIGLIIHDCLEAFWREIQSQSNLLKQTEVELARRVENLIGRGIQKICSSEFIKLNTNLLSLETKRLRQLILETLELEKKRPPFQVLAIEETHAADFNGLPLKLRMDRIDDLFDQGKIMIDYKTGTINIKHWFDERIVQPQMLLYVLFSKIALSAIAYLQIRKTEIKFSGVCDTQAHIEGIEHITAQCENDWNAQLELWQQQLAQTVNAFLSGQVKRDPIQGETTCKDCHLQTLCRIHDVNL